MGSERGQAVGICSGASEMHKGTHDLGAKLARREGWGSPRTTWEAGLVPCSEAIWADWGAALQHQTPDSHPLCGLHWAPNPRRSLSEANTEVGAVSGMTPPHSGPGRACWQGNMEGSPHLFPRGVDQSQTIGCVPHQPPEHQRTPGWLHRLEEWRPEGVGLRA